MLGHRSHEGRPSPFLSPLTSCIPSLAVTGVPTTLLLPIVTLSVSLAILAAWAAVALLLLSTGTLEPASPGFGHLHVPLATWGWLALLTFGALWMLCFVRHLQHFVLMMVGWLID